MNGAIDQPFNLVGEEERISTGEILENSCVLVGSSRGEENWANTAFLYGTPITQKHNERLRSQYYIAYPTKLYNFESVYSRINEAQNDICVAQACSCALSVPNGVNGLWESV